MPTYSSDGLVEFENLLGQLPSKLDQLKLSLFSMHLSEPSAIWYRNEGLLRRIGLVGQSILTIFEAIPPSTSIPPPKKTLDLATICLHANVVNLYGILDNIAHVWVKELHITGKNGKPLKNSQIGLSPNNSWIRNSFSDALSELLDKHEPWMEYLEKYRHSLAHRVPLYIPPHMVDPSNAERYRNLEARIQTTLHHSQRAILQDRQIGLTHFKAMMIYDVNEVRGVAFHAQLLTDFLTIEEICYAFKSEIENRRNT